MCTLPDSKAATRVASELIGVNTTRVTLVRSPALKPHQSLLTSNTVFTSASRLTSLKGPVPLAWRRA